MFQVVISIRNIKWHNMEYIKINVPKTHYKAKNLPVLDCAKTHYPLLLHAVVR